MFETLEAAPPDPILGLNEAFKREQNPAKINLGVGVYKDERGDTPTLACVREAERLLLERGAGKTYLPISGAPDYAAQVGRLIFGESHPVVTERRVQTAHTPGGTGALRVAADFLKQRFPATKVWLSDPTWENHAKVFAAAGLETRRYPYYDPEQKNLSFSAMTEALAQAGPGDAVLLHACCHNPSGVDPSAAEWERLLGLATERRFLPFFDFAYQGFGDGLSEDAQAVRAFARAGLELLVASSFSKNFGLYNERVGALSLVATSEAAAERSFGHVKAAIRANYSNPPAHGAQIVAAVLGDPALTAKWEVELTAMRTRIHEMRQAFVGELGAQGVARDFGFITRQKGMFSFSGLTREQVEKLRDRHGIYIVGSGRINVAGMTRENLPVLCRAIKSVL